MYTFIYITIILIIINLFTAILRAFTFAYAGMFVYMYTLVPICIYNVVYTILT